MDANELAFMTVSELAPLIESKQVSPVDLVEAQLGRIEALDDVLRAYIHVDAEGARSLAQAAATEIAAGGYKGPLHGVTVAHKDIIDVKGMPTTAASKILPNNIAAEDATVAGHFRAASAICLGKLNLIEFASGSMGLFGFARNPWNLAANPGGSSSGSGTAVAAGLVTVATGSDTGGSVRSPSGFCGIAGLRVTFGRVSRAGVIPLSWSQDSVGPMARSVEDLALMLNTMAGSDRHDSTTATAVTVPDFSDGIDRGLSGLRLGVPDSFFMADLDPEVERAIDAAIKQLEALGAEVKPVSIPSAEFAPAASWVIAYSESYVHHREWFFKHSRDYTPAFLHKISAAALTTAEERIVSQQIRQVVTREIIEALEGVDAIIAPTSRVLASAGSRSLPAASLRWSGDMSSVSRPASLAGVPSLSVPIGFAADNTPMAMQLMGRPWQEQTLFRLGLAYERAAKWVEKRPPELPAEIPPHYEPSTSTPITGESRPSSGVDATWVMDVARLQGLTFLTEEDAAKIAPMLAPVKEQIATAREVLDLGIQPPTRAAGVLTSS